MLFAEPIYLYLMPLVVGGLAALLLWSERRRRALLAQLGAPALIERLSRDVNHRGRRHRLLLWLVAAAALMLALARPQWGERIETVQSEGIQVVVALDISTSMLADDIKPTRLERARLEIAELMNRLDGDEVALVLFSGSAFVQFPLTSDYATARRFLESARPGVISKPGTNVSEALQAAHNAFDTNSSSQRVVVLITDGEAHDADALRTAQALADEGIRIDAIGFGSPEGAPVPQVDADGRVVGPRLDAIGAPLLTRLDEATLEEIARIGGGRYARAEASGQELDALIDALSRLQQGAMGERQDVRRVERFQLFLAIALGALGASMLVPDRVPPRRAAPSLAPSSARRSV